MNTDDSLFPELTRRQEEILALIVRAHTQSPEPVSSKFLVENYGLSLSTATIRNEMSALEQLGYVAAPHTSAGRVPTENGYRYFVRRLLANDGLSEGEQSRIADKMQTAPLATEQWMRTIATMLARTSHSAALVTPPISEVTRFKHIELIAIQGRLALMVLVLQDGAVHQQMLTLADPLPQVKLGEAAEHINGVCIEGSANEVRVRSVQLALLEREIAELIADLMDNADNHPLRLIYRDGLSEIVRDFGGGEGAEQAVRVFEERALLSMILHEVLSPTPDSVRVLIAGEGRWEELSHLTMILSRYGVPGQMTGAIGVLGSTRMNYGRAIHAVGYVSSLMTSMLTTMVEDKPALPKGRES